MHFPSDVPATTPKIKNQGRVAAGKKMAEQNRQVREAKRQQEAPKSKTQALKPEEKLDSNNSGYYILGIGGLIVSALGVYYQREAILNAIGRNRQQTPTPAPPEPEPMPPEKKTAFGKRNKIHLIYIYIYIYIYIRHHV